jgi:hypothetical protein
VINKIKNNLCVSKFFDMKAGYRVQMHNYIKSSASTDDGTYQNTGVIEKSSIQVQLKDLIRENQSTLGADKIMDT